MMLGGPERIVAQLIHHAGHVARGPEHFAEPRVGIAPFVGRRPVEADLVQVDLSDIQHVEAFDHVTVGPFPWLRGTAQTSPLMPRSMPPRRATCHPPGMNGTVNGAANRASHWPR